MSQKLIFLVTTFIFCNSMFSQKEYTEKYDNGKIKVKGSIVDNTLTGNYVEYYKNGEIKTQGKFKDCQYETNHTKIYIAGCGVGNNSDIRKGKKQGEWKDYYENGTLKSKYNYFCGLRQGNYFYYRENGKLDLIDFYTADKEMGTQEFYENGLLSKNSTYSYQYSKHDGHHLKTTVETEYYEDGSVKIQRTINELQNDIEKESFKEYYPNGFLKTESEIVDLDKNGVYREFYENGKKVPYTNTTYTASVYQIGSGKTPKKVISISAN